jgi:ELWxxDGT repeat protein
MVDANPVSIADKLYFIAGSQSQPTQKYLWRTDGTPSGTFTITASVADFTPNYLLTALNGNLLLRAATPATGAELWISDGTRTGIRLLKEIQTGPASATYNGWFGFNGHFYFALDEEGKAMWWNTDGTAANTTPLTIRNRSAGPVNAQMLAQNNSVVYLTAHVSDKTVELWRFDRQGFQIVKTFTGATSSQAATVVGQAVLQNNKLYFFASVAGGSSGIWRSDGTTSGTTLLLEKPFATAIESAPESGLYPHTLIAPGSEALFFFEDDPPLLRLWRLDSAAARFTLVKTMRARSDDGLYHAIHYDVALTYDKKFYFALNWHDDQLNRTQTEFWQSDGTPAGTERLVTLPFAARLALVSPHGLFILGPASLLVLPWTQPYPTRICNLASPSPLYPTLFAHRGQLYITERTTGSETASLWRLDPATLQPITVFLPVVKK